MDFLIINQQTGRTYSFNVDQDTAGPGVVTFDVQEQIATARVGDYLVGDNSFQQSQITVTQGQIVLKVNANNKVAQIKLGADDLGSEIDISAEQVKINGIIFTEGTDPIYTPGDIATSNYVAGSTGWKIDGDGSAEFNNVVVRGDFEADGGNIAVNESGLVINVGTFDASRLIIFGTFANGVLIGSTTLGTLYMGGADGNGFTIGTQGQVNDVKELTVSGSKVNFSALPTSDSGLDVGDLWRDGNTVKVKT
jgi:hypothetical protein